MEPQHCARRACLKEPALPGRMVCLACVPPFSSVQHVHYLTPHILDRGRQGVKAPTRPMVAANRWRSVTSEGLSLPTHPHSNADRLSMARAACSTRTYQPGVSGSIGPHHSVRVSLRVDRAFHSDRPLALPYAQRHMVKRSVHNCVYSLLYAKWGCAAMRQIGTRTLVSQAPSWVRGHARVSIAQRLCLGRRMGHRR